MNVLHLQVFVSLFLVAGGVLLLAYTIKQSDYEHADRLALFPLEDDDGRASAPPPSTPSED